MHYKIGRGKFGTGLNRPVPIFRELWKPGLKTYQRSSQSRGTTAKTKPTTEATEEHGGRPKSKIQLQVVQRKQSDAEGNWVGLGSKHGVLNSW
jgi:hypothetical protein